MADIVERLRALVALRRQAGLHKSSDTEACWLEEAAAEIERLRAERPPAPPEARELVESLRHWLDQEPAGSFRAPDLRKAIAFIERAAAQQVTPPWQPIETAPKECPAVALGSARKAVGAAVRQRSEVRRDACINDAPLDMGNPLDAPARLTHSEGGRGDMITWEVFKRRDEGWGLYIRNYAAQGLRPEYVKFRDITEQEAVMLVETELAGDLYGQVRELQERLSSGRLPAPPTAAREGEQK